MIGIVFYVIMIYGLKQAPMVAENRSIVFGACSAIYMILFGHGLPTRINPMA
jgi:hypothetical protein